MTEIERLKEEIKHLRACKEFESNMQRQVMDVGLKYMDIKDGKTVCVSDAWDAIVKELEK